MLENFSTSLGYALGHEGGFVNHPRDPGGATNNGVTQIVYDAYRDSIGLPQRSVRYIEAAEVRVIYQNQYWAAVRADALPDGLDYAVFDFAVNSGPMRSGRFLQAQLGVKQDGHIGLVTITAAREVNDVEGLIERLCAARLAWMRTLSTWEVFGVGWARRVEGDQRGVQSEDIGVVDRACRMARGADAPPPIIAAPHKAQGDEFEDRIIALQDALRGLGKNPGTSDGFWGPKTRGAVMALLSDPPTLY